MRNTKLTTVLKTCAQRIKQMKLELSFCADHSFACQCQKNDFLAGKRKWVKMTSLYWNSKTLQITLLTIMILLLFNNAFWPVAIALQFKSQISAFRHGTELISMRRNTKSLTKYSVFGPTKETTTTGDCPLFGSRRFLPLSLPTRPTLQQGDFSLSCQKRDYVSSTHRESRSKERLKASSLSSSKSNDNSLPHNRGILAIFRKIFTWLMSKLIMNPFNWFVEIVVDSLYNDGTITVPNIAEKSITTPALQSATILEDDVSLVSNTTTDATRNTTKVQPSGDRWAIAAPDVDLSGDWEVIIPTDSFKDDYDTYLAKLGQPYVVRSMALSVLGMTTETCQQRDQGRSLLLRTRNIRGTWDRTLVTSGADLELDDYTPLLVPIMSADSELVNAEAWWESNGTVHVSWLRGVEKYGGGAFESRRYLESNGDVYVCQSTFHPNDVDRDKAKLEWRFRRPAT